MCVDAGLCVACHPDSFTYYLDQDGAWWEWDYVTPLDETVPCASNDDCVGPVCTADWCVCGALSCIYGQQTSLGYCLGFIAD